MTSQDPGSNGNESTTAPVRGVITRASPVDGDQLLRRIVARVEALGLDILAVIDHSGDAGEVGLTMPDTKLVMFGRPSVATPIMLVHPLLALDLPLKLLLWETADGRTFLSYNEPSYLSDRFHLSPSQAERFRVVEEIARTVTESAAQ